MLTVDYQRLGVRHGETVLDLGCGSGRHAFESARQGCRVVALDSSLNDVHQVKQTFAADPNINVGVEPPTGSVLAADATALPFPDNCFDRIIASEILEHIDNDTTALSELSRVLRPGGTIAISVPAWLSERVCWGLSQQYSAPFVSGGHVRIYTSPELLAKLTGVGLVPTGRHGAHSLHAPYWWLRCAVGPTNDQHRLVSAYHRFLVWDMMKKPWLTRKLDDLLNRVLPKSLVVYAKKSA